MQKGVFENTIDISLHTLIREGLNSALLPEEIFMKFRLKNRNSIDDIFKYKKFNDDFTDKLSVYNDGTYIVGSIRPSYNEFLDKLLTILNIKHNSRTKDDDELTKNMLERVELLKGITTTSQLQREFPLLYRDLFDGRNYINSLKEMKNQGQLPTDAFDTGNNYIYSCAFKPSLKGFVSTQAEMYRRYVTDRFKLKERLESISYNNIIRNNFDQNKLAMLVIHGYISKCENSNDIEMIKEYIEIVEKYFNSSYDLNVFIILNGDMRIDINNIKYRLDNLKRRVKDKSSVVEWVLVPDGGGYKQVKKEKGPKAISMTYEETERLKAIGDAKTAFYESTPYTRKAIGLRKYRGYVAYIFPNGKIILDREFNRDAPSTAKDNAFYVMDAGDFIEHSGDDKTSLRSNSNVAHHNHTKNWKRTAMKYINMKTSEEMKEEAKKLIYRLSHRSI